MSPRSRLLAAVTVPAAVLLVGSAAFADTTLRHRIAPAGGTGYQTLTAVGGEKYVVRRGAGAKARPARARQRRSLLLFAQLTDPQIADEMSPARVDFADPAGGEIKSSWRPQEAMGLQVFDSVVRSVNANRRSPVKQGNGKRGRLAFALTTGDLADNQQFNETTWFRTVLDGGTVDPYSGKPISATNPCPGASASQAAAIDADVAARQYTGMGDYDDYATAPDDRKAGFWDPDVAAPVAGPYAAFPRYPGLMERAQAPFVAAGLDVPWFISRGNHDGLIQGNAPASTDLFRAIATGCLKVFPSAAFDPSVYQNKSADELFAAFGDPAFIAQLLASGRSVAPDPDRHIVSKVEYRKLINGKRKHGFAYTPKKQLTASARHGELLLLVAEARTAVHLTRHRRRGRRAERQPRRPAVPLAQGRAHRGAQAPPARRRVRPPHDRDDGQRPRRRGRRRVPAGGRARLRPRPARSTPIHRGEKGKKTVAALFEANPNVISYVAGHTHATACASSAAARPRLLADQHRVAHRLAGAGRLIEIMDNRRRHAVAVRHAARLGGAGRRARTGSGERVHDQRSSRRWRARSRSTTRRTRAWRARPAAAPSPARARTATSSSS